MDIEKLRAKTDPRVTALLVIDMQRDYCCRGGVLDKLGFETEGARKLAVALSDFVDRARQVLPSIIHLKMTRLPNLASGAMKEHYHRVGLQRDYDPAFSEFYGVIPADGDIVIPKYRYSGFTSTYLDMYLRAAGIQTLVLTGVATNVCVESTARDAFMHDYSVVVVSDMTVGTSEEAKKWSLSTVETFFGQVVSASDIEKCWEVS